MNNRYDYQPSPLKFFGQDDPEFQEDDYFNSKPKQNDSFKRDGFGNDRFSQQNDSFKRDGFGNDRFAQQNNSFKRDGFRNDRFAQQNDSFKRDGFGNDRFAQQNDNFKRDGFGNDRFAQQNNSFKRDGFGNDRFAQQNDSFKRDTFGNDRFTQQNDSFKRDGFGNDRFAQQNDSFKRDGFGNDRFAQQNNSFKRDGFGNDRFAQQNDSYQRVKYGNSQQTQQSTNNTTYSEYNYQQNKKVIDEKADDGVIRIGPQKGPAAVIISILVLIYFFGSMIGIILTAKINPAITLILFGQLFFVFGSIAFIASKNKMKDIFLLLFPLIGGGVMLAGGVMLSDDKELIDKLAEFAPLLLLILFLFIGVGITISTITKEIKAKNRCTAEVEAVVVDVKSRLSSGKNRHTVYCPIFEYQYYGQTFQKSPDVYTNVGVPKIGDTKTVYINPNDPTDLYIKNYSATILSLILGLLFTGFSLLALFSVIPTYF